MTMIEVDVWVRGTNHAVTHKIPSLSDNARSWSDADVGRLLTEMLLALEREKNPRGEPPTVTLRGFNWIVSPYDSGVVIHRRRKWAAPARVRSLSTSRRSPRWCSA